MALAIAFAISVCDWRGRKPPTACPSGLSTPTRTSISSSWSTGSGMAEDSTVKIQPGKCVDDLDRQRVTLQRCASRVMEMQSSGRNIRHELHLQQGDVVLQLQLALLQAAQLQFFMPAVTDQGFDRGIEIAMLDFEFDNPALDVLRRVYCHSV